MYVNIFNLKLDLFLIMFNILNIMLVPYVVDYINNLTYLVKQSRD